MPNMMRSVSTQTKQCLGQDEEGSTEDVEKCQKDSVTQISNRVVELKDDKSLFA